LKKVELGFDATKFLSEFLSFYFCTEVRFLKLKFELCQIKLGR